MIAVVQLKPNYTWDYDAVSSITQATSPDGTSTYTYDNTDQRLQTRSNSVLPDEAYSDDANGNRTNTGYNTTTNNRLQSDGTYNYEYDNEGNRTKRTSIATGEVMQYSWNYRNRLIQVVVIDNASNIVN